VVGDIPAGRSVEVLRREFPEVSVIAHPSDRGLARAYNVGLRHLGFPTYILVMHDSVEVSAGALAHMVRYLREHPSTAGVVAPRIDPGGSVQSQRPAIMDLMHRRPQRPHPIMLVGATCALVRGSVFSDVGLYDERFRSHHEAFEWSLRARRKGYTFALLPEATVVSRGGVNSRRHWAASADDRLVDTLWLVYKHGGRRWATVLYGVQRLLVKWFEFRWRDDRQVLRQLSEARADLRALCHRFQGENQLPQRPTPEATNPSSP
jgi:GT2 family glycosyltransferase